MIIPDVNLLLYATSAAFAEHARARRWLEELMNGEDAVGLAAPALFGFLRLGLEHQPERLPMAGSRAAICTGCSPATRFAALF